MAEFHVLNLGAGVQSTFTYLRYGNPDGPQLFQYAVFADTQEEPADVYRHLRWLQSLEARGYPPILIGSKGKLGDHLKAGTNSTGGRFASIPAFTKALGDEREGRTRRQCTKEYKIEVIDRVIRRQILGLQPRQRIPRGVHVVHYIGISLDEMRRSFRILKRYEGVKWASVRFPLLEARITRGQCRAWFKESGAVPHAVPRSACVFCPFHSDEEWVRLQREDPEAFARAVEIDEALRVPGNVVNRNMDKPLYLHRSCHPLGRIDFVALEEIVKQQPFLSPSFIEECEGMCGV